MMEASNHLRAERRWLLAALGIAVFYSLLGLRLAFRLPGLVQDDARQHVFWMERFRDPTLFPNDFIADYFQAVAPAGYKALYWIFAKIGLDPLLLARILPAAIGIAVAYLAFRLFLQLMADPRGAFLASVLLSQMIWLNDDVISATPRAFAYPLFLAFLLFLLRRQMVPCLLMLALEGLTYPQAAFVSLGVLSLRLMEWKERRLQFSRDRLDYAFCAAGLLVVAAVLIPFAHAISPYGPVIDRQAALALPEFLRHGRSDFFVGGIGFWLNAGRSGLFPDGIPWHLVPLAIAAPILAAMPGKFPSFQGLRQGAAPLIQVAVAAVAMWAAAHVFLFHLHLPARYSQWVFRILIALVAAMMLTALWDIIEQWRQRLRQNHHTLAARAVSVLLLLVGAYVIAFPHLEKFPDNSYREAQPKDSYDFLRAYPKDTVIATLTKYGNLLPAMAQRSVFVSAEYAVPYHQGYYRKIRQRGQDLVRAHYTSRPEELRSFIEQNHIDLIIITPAPFTAQYLSHLRWFGEIAPVREIAQQLERGEQPALSALVERCKIWENKTSIILDARLIAQTIRSNENSAAP